MVRKNLLLLGANMCTFALLSGITLHAGQAEVSAQSLAPVTPPQQLTLAAAEELLLQRNLAIAANRHQLELSQALRQIAGYKPNPTLQIAAEQFPVWSPVAGSYPRYFSTNPDVGAEPTWTAQVSKLFERGGKRESRVEQAEAQIGTARAQIFDAFRTQLLQLRQAFATAILAKENLALAQAQDTQYQRTEELTGIKVKAGDLAEMELFRVRAGRLPFRQAILDAQLAQQQAIRDILNLLNARQDAGSSIEIMGEFASKPLPLTVDELRAMALKNRPDIQAARSSLTGAQAGLHLAEAQRTRDVSVALEYQRVGSDSALGVIAQVPLFVYNNQKAGIAQATAQQHVVEAQLRQAEAQAVTDVEKAWQAYLAARNSMELYSSENLVQVEKLRAAIAYSYQRGEASLFELLDAERSARQATVAYNQARATYQLALWQMEAAVGQPLN
ncbi:MAG TPA: TolC family protein [Bryobacteraceae bacterium]|nr:TolC family protein [Bryobacteraceae bacterium]